MLRSEGCMLSRVAAVYILTCLIWSTVWLFIKIAVSEVPPVSFAAMRLIIAILVMVPITIAVRTPLPKKRRDWLMIGGTGILLLGFNYALLNWGMQFVSSGLTAVLQAMTPAFALVFAHYLLPDERITRRKAAGLLLGIAGIATIFWDQLTFGTAGALAGSITVTLGAVCVALAYVIVRREGRHLHPSVLTSGQMTAAFIPLMIYGWTVEGNPFELHWTRSALLAAMYLALAGSVLAVAADVAATAPIATRLTKLALADGGHATYHAALQWEALAQPVTLATEDLQEGIRAAREKRTPDFRGR